MSKNENTSKLINNIANKLTLPNRNNINTLSDVSHNTINNLMNNINTLTNSITNINSSVANTLSKPCDKGSKCWNDNNLQKLKNKYKEAKHTANHAPDNLRDARYNYYTFLYRDSPDKWRKIESNKYAKEGKIEYDVLNNTHREKISELISKLKSYSDNYKYNSTLDDYIKKINSENKDIQGELDNNLNTIYTNDRIVWYENKKLTDMSIWKSIIKYIYILLVIAYIYMFITNELWKPGGYRNNYVDIFLLVIFILWPYISMYVSVTLFRIIKYILSFIPIDVYTNYNPLLHK